MPVAREHAIQPLGLFTFPGSVAADVKAADGGNLMDQLIWQIEPGGGLASETGGFRLVVQKVEGSIRFLVLRQAEASGIAASAVAASGTEDTTCQAMAAATRVAIKLSDSLIGRYHLQPATGGAES